MTEADHSINPLETFPLLHKLVVEGYLRKVQDIPTVRTVSADFKGKSLLIVPETSSLTDVDLDELSDAEYYTEHELNPDRDLVLIFATVYGSNPEDRLELDHPHARGFKEKVVYQKPQENR
jgi:hypothetical protein